MVDTIEKTLSPVFFITFFLGVGILRYPLNELRYRFSIFSIYMLTLWSVYAYALYYTFGLISSLYKSALTYFVLTINLFLVIISIIMTICGQEKFRQCIRKLGHVDDTLEKLGTSKEYRRMQNFMIRILIMWILITCMSFIFDTLLCVTINNDMKTIIIPWVMNYSIYANTITDITFVLLLRHIGTRLDKINDLIEQLSRMEDCGLKYKWKKSLVSSYNVHGAENHKHVLWTIIHLHSELCRIAHDINSLFGMQMTLQMISYFVILISICYYHYHAILHPFNFYEDRNKTNIAIRLMLSSDVWCTVFLIKLLLLNHMCESVSTKAQQTKSVIHKLTNLTCFAEMREEICQFILQMSLRPLKFTGLGLFHFGYSFIRKFFVGIITAVLFMAQINILPPQPIIEIM